MVKGWSPISLGDILRLERRPIKLDPDKEYAEIGIYSYGRGIFHKRPRTGFEVGNKDLFLIRQTDFIFQITFAWEGAVGLASEAEDGMYGSVRFPTYHVNETICYSKFLLYYFKTADGRRELVRLSPGSAGRNRVLNTKRLPEIYIPLPPLEEQRRIVSRIEALVARLSAAQSLRKEASKEAEILTFSYARKIFSDLDVRITELGKLVDETRNGIQTGPFGAQLGSSDFLESGHPVITIGNVQYSGLETGKLKFISEEKAQHLSRFLVHEGDILFARMGTVGRCCVVPKSADGWVFNYHLIRVALDMSLVEPRYIHWLIRASQDIKDKLFDEIRGATREGVNSRIVASLPCRVPPLEEQRRLVAYLDGLQARVSQLRHYQEESQQELDALMSSILDKAFKGEL